MSWRGGHPADGQAYKAYNLAGTEAGPHLNIKTVFPRYVDFHVKDKTVARPFYL